MKRIIIVLNAIIFLSFLIIVSKTNNEKNNIAEEGYSLRVNYNYLYEDDEYLLVNLYSNKKTPSFSYIDKNSYYLCDYMQYFYIEVAIDEIEVYDEDCYYRFELSIKIPNLSSASVSDLYLMSVNQYHTYMFNIGTLNIRENNYLNTISYKSLSKEIDLNILSSITLEFDIIPNVKSLIGSEELNLTYTTDDNYLTINIDSINLTKELYLVIEMLEGIVVLENIVINNNTIGFDDNRYFMSIGIRSDLND